MFTKICIIFLLSVSVALGANLFLNERSEAQSRNRAPKQVLMGSAARTDSFNSKVFVELLPTPGQVFTTTETSTLMVDFTGSATLSDPLQNLEYQAVVDGVPVAPGPMRYSGSGTGSISYSGFLSRVAAGAHTVTMQVKVSGGTASLGSRTFTVWVVPE